MKSAKNTTTENTVKISVNCQNDCWKKDFTATAKLTETRINGYEFENMPSSYTEVYTIVSAPKKFSWAIGKTVTKWVDNNGSADAQARNAERCATMIPVM